MAWDTLTCMKYSSNRQSTQGSATSIGRTSLEMSQHFIKIIFSWKREEGSGGGAWGASPAAIWVWALSSREPGPPSPVRFGHPVGTLGPGRSVCS